MRYFTHSLLLITLLLWGQPASSLTLSPLQQTPYLGDLPVLKKKGVIRILVAADLGFYYIEGGRPKGIIAELLFHFEKHIKKQHPNLNLQMIPVTRDQLLPLLAQGYGDLSVANLTITLQRLEKVDFSDPVLDEVNEFIITGKDMPAITSIEQLSGKEVWVRASSSYFEDLERINALLSSANKAPALIYFIEETLQDYELMELVNSGHIGATVLDSHKAKIWSKVMDNIQVHQQLPIRRNGKIAWALRKQSPELQKMVNRYLKNAKAGTLLGNVIYNKYLNHTNWLKRAINPRGIAKLNSMSLIFKKYSEQYTFDPLMMAAQGFQESGLDQGKVSHKGAIGVMQVLPSTAKDPYINIPNIHQIDNNIHAGVKYMNHIRERYFTKETISHDNQVYFSLAAYNAGPGRIQRMRRLAKKHGYNPDIWFKNVEIITRRNVGKEPIHYVANINRYYVIYKQIVLIQQTKPDQSKIQLILKPTN